MLHQTKVNTQKLMLEEENFDGVETCKDGIVVVEEDHFPLTNTESDEESSEESGRPTTEVTTYVDEDKALEKATEEIEESESSVRSLHVIDEVVSSPKPVTTFVTVKKDHEVHSSPVSSKCPQIYESIITSATKVPIHDGPGDDDTQRHLQQF